MNATPTHNEMVASILATFETATPSQIADGAAWYSQALNIAHEIAEASGYTVEQVATAMAHLSPRQFWARNVSLTWRLCWAGTDRGIMRGPAGRAWDALADPDDPLSTLRGPKTRAFALNILGDENAVTIDVWAARVAGVDKPSLSRRGVYAAVSEAYRTAARIAGVPASTMQATTWIVRRGRAE